MNYDSMITDKQSEKQKIVDKMEEKKKIFLDKLTKFTIEWFEKETLSTIKSNSEKVFELGENKARELKSEIKELQEKSPELVKQYMEEQHLWWHTNEDKVSYYSGNRNLLDKHVEKIRQMFGELGRIFIKYNLVKAGSEYNRNHSSSWISDVANSSKLKYSYGMIFPDEIYDVNNEYLDLIKKAQDINEQIKKLEDKKKRENVEDWWTSL